jgi:hypothetical protein
MTTSTITPDVQASRPINPRQIIDDADAHLFNALVIVDLMADALRWDILKEEHESQIVHGGSPAESIERIEATPGVPFIHGIKRGIEGARAILDRGEGDMSAVIQQLQELSDTFSVFEWSLRDEPKHQNVTRGAGLCEILMVRALEELRKLQEPLATA